MSEIKELAFRKGVSKPHFYKIEYFGKTSYLLGTYHWGVSLDEFPAEVRERAEAAETVIVEILGTNRQMGQNLWCESNMDECLIQVGQNAPGPLLKRKYRRAIEPFLSRRVTDKVKSFFEISFPSNAWPALISDGGSLDFNISVNAINSGKKVVALDNPSLRQRAQHHARSLRENFPTFPKLHDLAKDAYEGDYSWFEKQAKELADYRAGKVFMDSETSYSIAYRNEAWVSKLLEELKSSESFVAVGIGHLYGNKGLLRLLRERNLRIERVDFE